MFLLLSVLVLCTSSQAQYAPTAVNSSIVSSNNNTFLNNSSSNNITIGNNLTYSTNVRIMDPVVIPQYSTGGVSIVLKGLQLSTWEYIVALLVLSVPSHGSLVSTKGLVVTNITYFNLWNTTDVVVLYTPRDSDDGYFNTPRTNAHGEYLPFAMEDTIVFRTVGMGRHKTFADDLIVVPIHIAHVNHGPPTLTVSNDTTRETSDTATIRGIQVVDHALDYNIDRVRVDVWTESGSGTLTLHSRHRHLADFEICAKRVEEVWQCSGDGHDQPQRRLTFVAIPDDITLILDELQYTSTSRPGDENQTDIINIRIYDGVGGECLTAWEQATYSPYNGTNSSRSLYIDDVTACEMTQVAVSVPQYNVSNRMDKDDNIGGDTMGDAIGGDDSDDDDDDDDDSGNIYNNYDDRTENDSSDSDKGNNVTNDGGNNGTKSDDSNAKRLILDMSWMELASGLVFATTVIMFLTVWLCCCFQMPPCLSVKVVVSSTANDESRKAERTNEVV